MKDRKTILIFLIIAVLALGLRVLYLDTALWYDEACSWFSARQDFPFGILSNLLNNDLQHTPLYFFLLHFWMKIFGEGEIAMRIPSLIFGLLTVPLVYIVSGKLTSKIPTIFITAISAVSPLLVLFSVEIRMYPVVIFLVLLSLNFLIDFEQKGDKKSLIKMVMTNILIPYTFVGGILYNISLFCCYLGYLYKNKKEDLKRYMWGEKIEIFSLIPFWILLLYYASQRSIFVVAHEGAIKFFNIIDIIRNFFGTNIIQNIYWPSDTSYNLTFVFCLCVVVPCVYFVYGFIKGLKSNEGFIGCLYRIFLINFILFIVSSSIHLNVMTVRYILYLLIPLFILSVIGLSKSLPEKHFKVFLTLFVVFATFFSIQYSFSFKNIKFLALKSVASEMEELGLNANDVIIMPFASDAPYYFRYLSSIRVLDFDFHKQVRNPYNNNFYDKTQQKVMAGKNRAKLIFDEIQKDKVFSEAYFNYFINNVTNSVDKGRYVILALYGTDADALMDINSLRTEVKDVEYVKKYPLDVMFKKYLCDNIAMLNMNFKYIKSFQSGNYTYYVYEKL